ncbi:MAG: type II toxin-antitoxin system death-on-curing family toxin [Synergistaceae bacterium]|jgi:death-on-curing protein|nr:type II toxin-antitoxin system death-on-curing family toxin [Synergistaceae bacterium]
MPEIIYLNIERALDTYKKTIDISGGGAFGFIANGRGRLEGILEFIKDDNYYPTFEEKLTHLFFSVCKFHIFKDGNKRMAIVLSAQMLLDNGYLYCAGRFIREMENISAHVASGKIGKQLLRDIIMDFIENNDDETVKLRIVNAIQDRV